jgi:hypothetical protein
VLGVTRPALQRRAKMPIGRVKKANHSGSRRQAAGRGQGPRLAAPVRLRIFLRFLPIGQQRTSC